MTEILKTNPNEGSKKPETVPEKTSELMAKIRQAFESKEGSETLNKLGDLLYESFKGPEYTPQNVINTIRGIYREHKTLFNPRISFSTYIQKFGPGLVTLFQLKLKEIGGYDLGATGENKDGIDGKLGKKN